MDSVEKIYEKNKTVKVIKDRTKIDYYLSIFKQNIVLLASLIPFWKKIAPKDIDISRLNHSYTIREESNLLKLLMNLK